MSEMIERAAKALAASEGDSALWYAYESHARTVIDSMRVPTKDMHEAGYGWLMDDDDVKRVWDLMIEAALCTAPNPS